MMQEVEDEPLFAERVAGIDIAKAEVMVTIRVPSDSGSGRRQQETRAFRAVRTDLLALADWLRCWQVTRIGMEATSDYWKPVYFLLEREGFDCHLYHAGQVKALPGRPKTDPLTELPREVPEVSGRMGILAATVAGHDHRRGCAAGPVAAGGTAARVA
jgi:transposase